MPLDTAPLARFLPLVLPHAPDCPRPVAEHALRLAAIDFCERARCWREIVTQTLTANGPAVDLPPYAAVFEIELAWFNGVELDPIVFAEVPYTDLMAEPDVGQPRWITQQVEETVSVYPYADGELRMNVFCRPRHGQSFGATAGDPLADALNVVPAFLHALHAETIAWGALQRILATPGEAYSNPEGAQVYGMAFERAAAVQAGRGQRGQQRAPRRSKPQFM